MKIVPENRLLIQPTVQMHWIEQHGSIEFMISETDQELFDAVWQLYQSSGVRSLVDFLMLEQARPLELQENDQLFALLCGADFIRNHYPSFKYQIGPKNLVWTIL